ncbi:MAG TPA: glutathione binding-like protein, partial [Gaiellaceae bacterium]
WYFGEGTRFVPADRYLRAQVLQWMFFEQYDHEPAIAVARFLIRFAQLPRADYEKRLPRLLEQGQKALAAMERTLDGRAWLVGDAMTLADIALFAYTHVAEEAELELAPYPAVRTWLDRVAAEPGHVPMG